MKTSLPLIAAALIVSSCTMGPRYTVPDVEMPNKWHTPLSEGMDSSAAIGSNWLESLNDPLLTCILERAAQQNLDLSIAGMRILQARLMRKGLEAERYPRIDASVMGGDLYCSKDILKSGLFGHCHSHKRNLGFFEAGFDASWEIDLFGYRTHQINAAAAKAEAAEESMEDLWVSLSAEIARNYIELRGLQQRRALLSQNIALLRDNLHLAQELSEKGFASEIETLHAEQQLIQLQAEKPLLDSSIDKSIHRLSVLAGYSPGDLFCELGNSKELPQLPCERPIDLPSDLLRRRPDIRRAERNLAAATEEVGTAIAALFPRFSLFGFAGEVATHFHSMTNGNGTTLFGAPQLLFPIFNSKLLQQDVKFNRIAAQEALYEYQRTVLASLEEMENGLTAFRYDLERHTYLEKAELLNKEVYRLTLDLYQKGMKDFLDVLTASRAFIAAEDAALQSEINLLLDYIVLYKALGGANL